MKNRGSNETNWTSFFPTKTQHPNSVALPSVKRIIRYWVTNKSRDYEKKFNVVNKLIKKQPEGQHDDLYQTYFKLIMENNQFPELLLLHACNKAARELISAEQFTTYYALLAEFQTSKLYERYSYTRLSNLHSGAVIPGHKFCKIKQKRYLLDALEKIQLAIELEEKCPNLMYNVFYDCSIGTGSGLVSSGIQTFTDLLHTYQSHARKSGIKEKDIQQITLRAKTLPAEQAEPISLGLSMNT